MIPFILEPEALARLLAQPADNPDGQNLLLVDLSTAQVYSQVHLENAVHVLATEIVSGVRPAVGKLPSLDQLERLFSRIGYQRDQHIVVYDDEGGGWAGRFIWTLDVIGHASMSYLNGGIHAWRAADLPTTKLVPDIPARQVKLTISHEFTANMQDILDTLDDPQTVIWDARAPEEYTGAKVVSARGGRIPGAINLEWTQAMDRDRQLRIRRDIVELLDSKGILSNKKIITHCQSHHRSGFTYLIGKSLGYNIRAYDGSWSEWGNDPDAPIEVG